MSAGLSLREIADLTGAVPDDASQGSLDEASPGSLDEASLENLDAACLTRVAHPREADATCVVFAEDEPSLRRALASSAGAILAKLTGSELPIYQDSRLLRVADPRFAFALTARELARREAHRPESDAAAGTVHPVAIVDATASLGQRVRIGAGTTVGPRARIGDDVTLGCNVVIAEGVVLGDRVVVQSGAVLGSTGFGYVRHAVTGEYLLFPQMGALVIEDDVEIGANTTIDRGALEETRIGRGTKIDNLVHIGHNCRIGRDVIIAAQVGISGSCVIGDGAVLAGQVGISDHCHIGPGVILGGQTGVYRGKTVTGPGEIFAGTPAEPLREHMRALAQLRRSGRGR